MVTFIANQIIRARQTGIVEGQNKYRAYFVNTVLYLRYKAEVDNILILDGYEDAIVAA